MQATDWNLSATLTEILSLAFIYPTHELAEVLASGEYREALDEVLDATAIKCDSSRLDAYQGTDTEQILHTLRAEATRLFIGAPDAVVPPYEGVWAAKDDGVLPLLFVNPKSMAVERFYHSCGVGRKEGTNEPLDHVGAELEFLSHLASIEAGILEAPDGVQIPEDAYGTFYREHFQTWAPRFAAAVAEQTREPFFTVAAEVLKAFVAPEEAQV